MVQMHKFIKQIISCKKTFKFQFLFGEQFLFYNETCWDSIFKIEHIRKKIVYSIS